MICFEQNVFKTNNKNKTNSLGLYFKFIFIFLFLILLWSSPVSVFAGRQDQEKEDVVDLNVDYARLEEYCSFVSWPAYWKDAQVRIGADGLTLNDISSLGINTNEYSKWGIEENIANLKDNYFVLDLPDEKALKVEVVEKADGSTELKSYAALVDPKTGGRNNTSAISETVQEFQGYYYYDIKTTTWEEDEELNGEFLYTRRVYFKYVELKKEVRGKGDQNEVIYGKNLPGKKTHTDTVAATGVWLYFLSNKTKDDDSNGLKDWDGEENIDTETSLALIDVFTGTSLSEGNYPYWESLFMWPMSSVTLKDIGYKSSASEAQVEKFQRCFNVQYDNVDTDGDGIIDRLDSDEDGDGIIDAFDYNKDVNSDNDGDGIKDVDDPNDDDGNKIPKSNRDDKPDVDDPDSDGDGVLDKYETEMLCGLKEDDEICVPYGMARIRAILLHDETDFTNISKEENFELGYFQRYNTADNSTYRNNNSKYKGLKLSVPTPTIEETRARIMTITKHYYYGNRDAYPTKYWIHKETPGTPYAGYKHVTSKKGKVYAVRKLSDEDLNALEGVDGSLDFLTYKSIIGTGTNRREAQFHSYFLTKTITINKKEMQLSFNTNATYSANTEDLGKQFGPSYFGLNTDLKNKEKSDSASFKSYVEKGLDPVRENDRIPDGVVNKAWKDATNNGADLSHVPREALRTLQTFLKTQKGAFDVVVAFVKPKIKNSSANWQSLDLTGINKEEGKLNRDWLIEIFDKLTIEEYNKYAKTNPKMCVIILTVMFEVFEDYAMWIDYSSDGISTTFYLSHHKVSGENWWNKYSSGCLSFNEINEQGTPIALSDGNELNIVNLYKAFGVDDNPKLIEFIESYAKGTPDISLLGLDSIRGQMILDALNGTEDSSGTLGKNIVLTKEEINAGKLDIKTLYDKKEGDPEVELYTGYVPYVAVLTKYNENPFDPKDFDETKIPPYEGNNANEIVKGCYNLILKDANSLEIALTKCGVYIFENVFQDETKYEDTKVSFLFKFNKKYNSTHRKTYTYSEFEALDDGALMDSMAENIELNKNGGFKRTRGIYSTSPTDKGTYAELITVSKATNSEDVSSLLINDYQKDSAIGTNNGINYFATFCIDAYSAEMKNGKVYNNKRESFDIDSNNVLLFPKTFVKNYSEKKPTDSTINNTASVDIYAMNAGTTIKDENGYSTYNIVESSAIKVAEMTDEFGLFSEIIDTILYKNYTDKNGKERRIYSDFISNVTRVDIEIIDEKEVEELAGDNFGYHRGEGKNDCVAIFRLTEEQLAEFNTSLVKQTKELIKDGTLKGLTLEEFEEVENAVIGTKYHILFANYLSMIFDRNRVEAIHGFVPRNPEDLVLSDTLNNVTLSNSNAQAEAEARNSIDWFNKDATDFNITAFWDLASLSEEEKKALEEKDGCWFLKLDLEPTSLDKKIGLFPKNYELQGDQKMDARKITGTLSVGRIPEAKLTGLKIGDYKIVISEKFYINETGFESREKSFNAVATNLSTWYESTSPVSYGKSAIYGVAFNDTYYGNTLFNKFNVKSYANSLLTNLSVKAVSYYKPEDEIKVTNNKITNKLSFDEDKIVEGSAETLSSVDWTPGMVVNYEYSYTLPQSTLYKTTMAYIVSLAGKQYSNLYATVDSVRGLYAINHTLIHFMLVPRTDGTGKFARQDGTVGKGALAYNANNYNDETFIVAEIPNGGNLSWVDDDSIFIKIESGEKKYEDVVSISEIIDSNRTIVISQTIWDELECIDSSGNLKNDLKITIQPFINYENFIYGKGAESVHKAGEMEIFIDDRISGKTSSTKLSSIKYVKQYKDIDSEEVEGHLSENDSLGTASSTIGNNKLKSSYLAQINLEIKYSKGDSVVSPTDENIINFVIPGTEFSGCNGAKRCETDNMLDNDWETLTIEFGEVGKEHDNAVKDIILVNGNDKNDILGVDNYGEEPAVQSLVSGRSDTFVAKELDLYAIVERIDNVHTPDNPECKDSEKDDIEVGHFELSYIANGLNVLQSTNCINIQPSGTYMDKHKTVDILAKEGDKIIFKHRLSSGFGITDLTAEFSYRLCACTEATFDQFDIDTLNNKRTETWDSGIDIVVKVDSVPGDIKIQGQYACQLDEYGKVVKDAEDITGFLEKEDNGEYTKYSFQASADVSVILANQAARDVYDGLNLKYTVFVYATQNGRTIYPKDEDGISGSAVVGKTYKGKSHLAMDSFSTYTVNAYWEDVYLGEGEVKIHFEVWPIPNLDSSYSNVYNSFPNLTGLWSSDVFDAKNPTTYETAPYNTSKPQSTNNYSSGSFNVSYSSKDCKFACKKDDDFLANEVRWTVRFNWQNWQNGIADWTSIKGDQEWYQYPSSLTNINYEFQETVCGYHEESYVHMCRTSSCSPLYNTGWTVLTSKWYGTGHTRLETDLNRFPNNQLYYRKYEYSLIRSYTHGHYSGGEHPVLLYRDTCYVYQRHEYHAYRTITGFKYMGLQGCRHEVGPDNGLYNWGPNGLLEGAYSSFLRKTLPDEVGYKGSQKAVSKFNSATIPSTYWSYMYAGGSMAGDVGPATNNNDSIHNWDTLKNTSYFDTSYAGGLKYHFYAEKVTATVEVASSRDNYTWHAADKWTVYNGESFKIRGKVVYEINTVGNYPRSPVQHYDIGSFSYVSDVFGRYYNMNQGGYDGSGFYIETDNVVNGKLSGTQKNYIAVFDNASTTVVVGEGGRYSKAWKRSGNNAWSPNGQNVDKFDGQMKSYHIGIVTSGYRVNSYGYWTSIQSKWNLYSFLKRNYGLTNYANQGVSQRCNYINTDSLLGARPTIWAEYKITGTSAYNKFVVRLPDSRSAGNAKTTAYWNLLPSYESTQDTIYVPITNISQDIVIEFNAFPFTGIANSYKFHPYRGATDDQHGNRYLCDVSKYTIKIRPTGNIIGDVQGDPDSGGEDGEAGIY